MTTAAPPRVWEDFAVEVAIAAPATIPEMNRCWVATHIGPYLAVCSRRHEHTGRHAMYGLDGLVKAVW